jgi:hypothetical protein
LGIPDIEQIVLRTDRFLSGVWADTRTQHASPSSLATSNSSGQEMLRDRPTDSGTWFIAFASFALGMLTLLAVVMGITLRSVDSRAARFLLTVPVLLLLIAAVTGYRLWRSPYENKKR